MSQSVSEHLAVCECFGCCTLSLQTGQQCISVLMCVFLSFRACLNQQSLRPVRRLRVEDVFICFFSSRLSSASLSLDVWAFLTASASLCSGCVWFGSVRLKRADGAVRNFFPGCWLEGLTVCGRSLFATGFNGVWCSWTGTSMSCLVKDAFPVKSGDLQTLII